MRQLHLVSSIATHFNAYVPMLQVTSEEGVENALSVCKKSFGRLDAAINCAGIGVAFKTYNANKDIYHKLADFEKVLKVRVRNSELYIIKA